MKTKTYFRLAESWAYCDEEDKSTEFMIEFMKDHAKVSHDTVMDFIKKHDSCMDALKKATAQLAGEFLKKCNVMPIVQAMEGGVMNLPEILVDWTDHFADYVEKELGHDV